ncbi:MAG TPA: hypothetical protein VN228_15715 [Pyrinomonadaceae bacterium]|nr:hypothetical protein [Pyrinomonadaceae bacterium]
MSSQIIVVNHLFTQATSPEPHEADVRGLLLGEHFSTHPNQAIFWSGGAEAEQEAAAIARQEGKVTFGMTVGGRSITSLVHSLTPEQAAHVYRFGSTHFAAAAAGEVEVVVRKYNAASLFVRTELPMLLKNLGVKRITFR